MSLVLATAPTAELLSLEDLKRHLRLEHTVEDAILQVYLEDARTMLEELLGRQCITATWDEWFDGWPGGSQIELGRAPVQSVTSVSYYDEDDVVATLSSTTYFVDTASTPARIVLNASEVWPLTTLRPVNAVKVRFVAGYGLAPSTVPAPLRQAVLLLAAHSYVHREPVLTGMIESVLPYGVWDRLALYRVRPGFA